MRVAILSDTHFGDDGCTLVVEDEPGRPRLGPAYPALARAVGRADYLVLLGDVLDFSVASFEKAYRHAKVFFAALQADRLATELIYIPGNHDFDIWHIVEHQVNVINQLKQGELPRAFKRSVPGVIDDRQPDAASKFRLPDVTPKPEWHDNRRNYGNLFLDHITRRRPRRRGLRAEGAKLTFNFAYPNLYLVTDRGSSILVTHGHYFESYWSLASDWLMAAGADIPLEMPDELNLQELVGLNLPLNQLACSGIGQAEPLTGFIRRIGRDIERGQLGELARTLDKFEAGILARRHTSRLRGTAERYVIRWIKRWILSSLAGHEHARYSKLFLLRPQVRDRFRRYFRCTLNEIAKMRREHGVDVPVPTHVVFGHTHEPIPWGAGELVDEIDGHVVHFCNTGGWVRRQDDLGTFPGAEVLIYETGRDPVTLPVCSQDLVCEDQLASA